MMLAAALAIARTGDLFAAVVLSGVYSLLSACFFVLMDAPDVALTEVAVGGGVSVILLLMALSRSAQREKPRSRSAVYALPAVLLTGALLIYGTVDVPAFGAADSPVQRHVNPWYLARAEADTGVANVVTAVLAAYRSYDTLGETLVIFTAGLGVVALLHPGAAAASSGGADWSGSIARHRILRIVSKAVIPPTLLFALYMQFHGETGPGGGFQAGVIFAAAVILHAMVFGLRASERACGYRALALAAIAGVLLYIAVGLVGLWRGAAFLDYSALSAQASAAQHIGIVLVELGIGVTVASTLILVYRAFARGDR